MGFDRGRRVMTVTSGALFWLPAEDKGLEEQQCDKGQGRGSNDCGRDGDARRGRTSDCPTTGRIQMSGQVNNRRCDDQRRVVEFSLVHWPGVGTALAPPPPPPLGERSHGCDDPK